MSENGIDLTSGVGRIVWGDPTTPRPKKDQKGQPVVDKAGAQVMEIAFGVAYPKEATVRQQYAGQPTVEQMVAALAFERTIWPSMAQEIATVWANGVPGRFAYKYVDGDTNDAEGKPYADREGYAGHFVLAFTQRINEKFAPPSIFKLVNGAYQQLPATAIKCGDYVTVGMNLKCEAPEGTNTPSIYVNPRAIEHVGYGTEIATGFKVDPSAMFAGRQHVLPPGATTTPQAAAGAPGMPGAAPVTPPGAPGGQMPGGMPGPVPGAPVAPPQPVAPPVPAGPTRPVDPTHIHAAGTPQEQWWINGAWTPAPVAAAAPLPPPATDFVQNAMGQPPSPVAAPGGAPGMPGMPAPR